VAEYTDQFEDLMADVQDENSHISEAWFVRCYVNGLWSSIKYQLRPLCPTSLTEAYWLAVDMEQAIPVTKQYSNYSTVGNSKVQFSAKDKPFFDRATESKPQHTPNNKVWDSIYWLAKTLNQLRTTPRRNNNLIQLSKTTHQNTHRWQTSKSTGGY
jgi:hypothetical protein